MAAAWRPRDNDDDEDDAGGGADDDDPHRSGPRQTRSAPRLLILPHNFRSLLVHSIPSSTSSVFLNVLVHTRSSFLQLRTLPSSPIVYFLFQVYVFSAVWGQDKSIIIKPVHLTYVRTNKSKIPYSIKPMESLEKTSSVTQ